MPTHHQSHRPFPWILVRAGLALAAALLTFAVCSASFTAEAVAQTAPMDFSDADQQLVDWPFTTVEYFVEEDGMNVWQHTRVQEAPSQVYDELLERKQAKDYVGSYRLMGAGRGAEPGHYTFVLVNDIGLRHVVNVKPDGSGAVLIVKSTPNATPTGYFKRALYPYRLGEEQTVRCERYDNLDE